MEIDYFDLPGNFTLIFFFFPVGNNWSLILKLCPGQKEKAFYLFNHKNGFRYGLNIQAEPTDDLCGNSDKN